MWRGSARRSAAAGLPGVLRTSNAGYLLDVDADVVDAHRFQRCVQAVSELSGDAGIVAARSREALALWRGEAFADAMLTGWGLSEINRLHELRLTAWERLYTRILRQDDTLELPAPAHREPVPAQLPALPGHFTGRQLELDTLDRALGSREPPVVLISGPAGMGKIALAVQWANRIADRFPDGQLFLDLRGHDPETAIPAAEAITHLLHGLGVPDERIPTALTAKANLYRSLLHGKHILIVLDNCGDAEDVLTLVPGGGTSLLLLTSRKVLGALVVSHAVCGLSLDALGGKDGLTLLTRVLGPDRVDREPGAAARLAELCGGMPLALRIAAAKLLVHADRSIRDLVTELAGADRLDSLQVTGDSRSVRAVFASAYRALTPSAGQMFRLLGQFPGPTFGAELAATRSPTRTSCTTAGTTSRRSGAGPSTRRCSVAARPVFR
jgi:hypothetical protein